MSISHPHIHPLAYLGSGARLEHIFDPAGLIVEPHHHLYHELDYVLSGNGVFAVGGQKVEVATGDMIYLARGVYHRRESDLQRPMELCNLILDDVTLRVILDEMPPVPLQEWPWWHRWAASDLEGPATRAFLHKLVRCMRPGPYHITKAQMKWLLPGIRNLLTLRREHVRSADPGLHRLAHRVRHNPERSLNLDEEAANIGVSRWWLSRTFNLKRAVETRVKRVQLLFEKPVTGHCVRRSST